MEKFSTPAENFAEIIIAIALAIDVVNEQWTPGGGVSCHRLQGVLWLFLR